MFIKIFKELFTQFIAYNYIHILIKIKIIERYNKFFTIIKIYMILQIQLAEYLARI